MKIYPLKNRLFYLAGFFFLFGFEVQAQRLDILEWPYGRIIIAEGDTLYGGPLIYHTKEDIVRIQNQDGTVSAFSPTTVIGFDVTNSKSGNFRQAFRTYRWNKGNDYSDFTVPTFFEQLSYGNNSLLRRITVVRRDMGRDPNYNRGYGRGMGHLVEERKDLYYILTPEQKVITLRNTKKDMERFYGKKSKEMKAFIKENKLSYNHPQHIVMMLKYYDALQ